MAGVVVDVRVILPAKFLRPKEKQLVLLDGPAQDVSEIILVVVGFRRSGQVEIVMGVEGGITDEFECLAMEFIGA